MSNLAHDSEGDLPAAGATGASADSGAMPFALFYSSGVVGAVRWTLDGRILDANDFFLNALCLPRQDLEAGTLRWTELMLPEFQQQAERVLAQLRQTGYIAPVDYELRRRDGVRLPVLMAALALPDRAGEAIAFVVDRTDRQRLEDELRRRDALLQAVIDNLPFECWARDLDNRMILQNRHAIHTWGDAMGQRPQEQPSIDEPTRQRWLINDARALAGEVVQYELRRCEGDQPRDELTIIGPVRSDEQVMGTVGVKIDISDLRRTEQTLRDAEERYRKVFQLAAFGVVVINPVDGSIVEFNDAAHRQLGYSRDEFSRLRITEVDAGESEETIHERMGAMTRRGYDEFDTRMRTRNGEVRDMLVTSRRLDLAGQPQLICVIQDITERNRLREQLVQSQKMEAVGRLAGGVAHDFNNVLAVISGYSEAMLRRLPEDSPFRAHAEEILKAADKAGALTRQLLAFGRRRVTEPQRVDPNQVLTSMSEMIRRVISRSIEISLRPGIGVRPILADMGQVEQVFLNLALNARDAMPDGGTLAIETSNREVTEWDAALAGVPAGQYTEIRVSDTGAGMDDATRARVFEPFFTTREGQGTGLGLSIVYAIVQQCHGTISVRSIVGQGTVFEILIPSV